MAYVLTRFPHQHFHLPHFLHNQSKLFRLPGNRLMYAVIVHCVRESPVSQELIMNQWHGKAGNNQRWAVDLLINWHEGQQTFSKTKKTNNNALSGVFILKGFEWLFSEQSWNDRDFHSAGGYITGKVCLHYSFLLLSSVLLLLSIHFSVCLFFAITWWVTSFRIVWKDSCFKMNVSNQLPRWHLAKNKQTTRISMW